jgi:hypothetical protein
MADDRKTTEAEAGAESRTAARRKFLRRASQIAVTTPAVTLLLAAGTKKSAIAGLPSAIW